MHLLITRPLEQAVGTSKLLEMDGHSCLIDPLLQSEALDTAFPAGEFGGIILTSVNAVASLEKVIGPQVRQNLPVFATGTVTAERARKAGFKKCHSVQGSATRLAQMIPEWLAQPGTTTDLLLLYPCAQETAHDMESLLKPTGIHCVSWPVYRMIEKDSFGVKTKSALKKGEIDGVLLYSARTASCFARLLGDAGQSPPLYVLSKEIGESLPGDFAALARHPEEVSEKSLRGLLQKNL